MAFSLLSRSYPALGPEEINDLSMYQFHEYMGNITELEKWSNEEIKETKKTNKELVEGAKKLGLVVPKKY